MPRAIVNANESEEAALVIALAFARARETARWQQRWRRLAAMAALGPILGVVFLASLLLAQSTDSQAWLSGFLLLTVGGLGCMACLVAASRQVPRLMQHIAKAYWTLEVVPFDVGHILWDPFRARNIQLQVFAPGADLWSKVMGCLRHSPNVELEAAVVQSLGHLAQNLESIRPQNVPVPVLGPEDEMLEVCRLVRPLLRTLSPSQVGQCTSLPVSTSCNMASQLTTGWLEFWRARPGDALQAHWSQLRAELRPWQAQLDASLSSLSAEKRVSPTLIDLTETRTRASSGVPQIFEATQKGLENEVRPQMQAEKADYERDLKTADTAASEQSNMRQHLHNMETQPLRGKLASKQEDLAVLQRQIASYNSQIVALTNQMGYDAFLAERERLASELMQSQTSSEPMVSARQVENDKLALAQMDDAISQMRTWRDRIGELCQYEAAVQELIAKCRSDLDTAEAAFQAENRTFADKHAKDHQAAKQALTDRLKVHQAPLDLVGAHQKQVASWIKDLTQSPESGVDQPPLSFRPDIERQVVEYRRGAFDSLMERVRIAVTDLETIDQQTRELTATCQKLAAEFAPWASEIRLPVWLVRYTDSDAWEPLLGPCVMQTLPANSRAGLRCEFDEAGFGLMRETLRGLPNSWQLDQSLVAPSVIAHASSQLAPVFGRLAARGLLSSELSVDIQSFLAAQENSAGPSRLAAVEAAPTESQSDHA